VRGLSYSARCVFMASTDSGSSLMLDPGEHAADVDAEVGFSTVANGDE
jgi:hypothetical protein